MLTEQLLETIQAERQRQIREADRVRLLTPADTEGPGPSYSVRSGLGRVSAVEGKALGRQPRPATDSPR